MFIGGSFILLGSAVITAAQNPGYFLGGRVCTLQIIKCTLSLML